MNKPHARRDRSGNCRRRSTRASYRVRNWKEYNSALVQRGSLFVWADAEALENWLAPPTKRNAPAKRNAPVAQRRGRPYRYSDQDIVCALTIGAVYRLPLRATQGLVGSLLVLLGLGEVLPTPHWSTLSRRRARLKVELGTVSAEEPLHLAVDSTGLKVYGEGEWKVRQHGVGKRRTWRKVHLAVDTQTGVIHAVETTDNHVGDSPMLPVLLARVQEPLAQVAADGAYDTHKCFEAVRQRQAEALIAPRRGARIQRHGNRGQERLARDENLRAIRKLGRAGWKRESGYHRRSLVETAMSRLKGVFAERLSARRMPAQSVEVCIRCRVLNQITHLGRPDSVAIEPG